MLHGSPSHLLHRFLPLFFLAEISSKLTFFAQSFGNKDLLHNGDTRMGLRITMESVLPSSKDFLLFTLNWFQFKAMLSLVGLLCTLSMWAINSSLENKLSRQWSHFELKISHTTGRDWWCLHKDSVTRADVCSSGAPQCTEMNIVTVIFRLSAFWACNWRELDKKDWRSPDTDKGRL